MTAPTVVCIQRGADVGGSLADVPTDGEYFAVTVRVLVKLDHVNATSALRYLGAAFARVGLTLVPGSVVDSRWLDPKQRRRKRRRMA